MAADRLDESNDVLGAQSGVTDGAVEVVGLDRPGELVDSHGALGDVGMVGAIDQDLPNGVGQEHPVGVGAGSQMVGGELGRLGPSGIDHPQLTPLGERPEAAYGVGEGVHVAV